MRTCQHSRYGRVLACALPLLLLSACARQPEAPPVEARRIVQEQIRYQQESVKALRQRMEQGAPELAVGLPIAQSVEAALAASAHALAQGGDGQAGQVFEQSEQRIKALQGMLALHAEWQQIRSLAAYAAGRQQLSAISNEDQRIAAALAEVGQRGLTPMSEAMAKFREDGDKIIPALELLQRARATRAELMAMQPSPSQQAVIEQAVSEVVVCAQTLCTENDERIKRLLSIYGFAKAELRISMPKKNSAPTLFHVSGRPGLRYVFVYAEDTQELDYPVPDKDIFQLRWSRRSSQFPLRMMITPEAFSRLEAEYQSTGQLRRYETGVKPANSLAVRWHAPWPANTVLANHLSED